MPIVPLLVAERATRPPASRTHNLYSPTSDWHKSQPPSFRNKKPSLTMSPKRPPPPSSSSSSSSCNGSSRSGSRIRRSGSGDSNGNGAARAKLLRDLSSALLSPSMSAARTTANPPSQQSCRRHRHGDDDYLYRILCEATDIASDITLALAQFDDSTSSRGGGGEGREEETEGEEEHDDEGEELPPPVDERQRQV